MEKREYTPEEIAQGKKVTSYYEDLDESDPTNQPTDNETSRPNPLLVAIERERESQEEDHNGH